MQMWLVVSLTDHLFHDWLHIEMTAENIVDCCIDTFKNLNKTH